MKELNYKTRMKNALEGKKTDMTPVASFTQTGIVDLMEKTDSYWPKAHSDPEEMAHLAISGFTIAGFESIRVPYCVTVLAEALGCALDMGKIDKQPSVISHPLSSLEDEVNIPENFLEGHRIPKVIEAISIIKDNFGENVPIIAGFEGPTTLAADLIGAERFLMSFIKNPDYVSEVIRSSNEACKEYAKELVSAGADIICVADPVASPELISPKMFDTYIKDNLNELSNSIGTLGVLHICGNVFKILDSMSRCGFDALSIEEKVNEISKAKDIVGERARLVGNIACATTLFNGTPGMVRGESHYSMEKGIDVLAPGCGLAPRSPLENVKALRNARDEYFSKNQ